MKKLCLVLAALACATSALRAQATYTVPGSMPTIQAAIAAASNGDNVLIGPGTFVERIDFLGKAITVRGQGPGQTTIDGGLLGTVVMFQGGEDSTSVLEDLTVTNGLGDALTGQPFVTNPEYGGAFAVIVPSVQPSNPIGPTIRNCVFENNFAAVGSVGYVSHGSAVTIEDCVVRNNSCFHPLLVRQNGAGTIFIEGSVWVVYRRCVFENNVGASAAISAGGQFFSSLVEDCQFIGNTSTTGYAGALYLGGNAVVSRCLFANNSAATRGGAISIVPLSAQPIRILNSTFVGNTAGEDGGAIDIGLSRTVEIEHCTITGNAVTMPPGANQQGLQAGGVKVDMIGNTTIRNSIIWGNSGGVDFELLTHAFIPTTLTITGSNIGNLTGPGIISVDPLFVDAANGDYRLSPSSPCIDAGDPAPLATNPAPTTDFDGNPRALFLAPDIGAYESTDIARSAAMAGTAAAPLLTINGMDGGLARRVSVGLGQGSLLQLAASPSFPNGRFLVAGALGIPDLSTVATLPAGLGAMAVPPCALAPALFPTLFTLANSFGPDPCGALVVAPPGSFSFFIPPVPVPLDVSFQALVEDGPASLVVSNGVILEIR